MGLMLLVAAACGQKPGVAESGLTTALPEGTEIVDGQVVDTETGEVLGTVEEVLGGGLGGDIAAGGETTTTTGGGTTTTGGGSTTTGGGGDPTGGAGQAPPQGGDTTGVTNDTIKIGIHAPLTGAAPVPSDSVEKGKDLYFRWMHEEQNQTLFGRKVEVVLRNDQYNPSTAVSVCKEMVERDKVFMLTGAAGTDQIQACARYAASVGVPYVGAGVTELVLDQLFNYFALSMTYNDQGPLLADYIVSALGAKGEKNGMLTFETPNFEDARDGFREGMRRQGATIHYERTVSKGAGTSEARSVVQEMQSQGIENVYVLTSPVWWLNVLKQADTQQYAPQWVGVGISMTFDTVASVGCGGGTSIDGAKFFSPFPAWIDVNKFDPDFRKAVDTFYPDERGGDDFMVLSWEASKTWWDMLENVGKDITREKFIYDVERMRGLKNGLGPVLNYAPNDHFGASQVHVNEARCSDRRWHTIKAFASEF
ncbi:MAG: ABC transporter substrate-binding protein [Actinomycetota bacterium]|nr:ABC transporter substrate-binding protein [Actinomycetota bacterium]